MDYIHKIPYNVVWKDLDTTWLELAYWQYIDYMLFTCYLHTDYIQITYRLHTWHTHIHYIPLTCTGSIHLDHRWITCRLHMDYIRIAVTCSLKIYHAYGHWFYMDFIQFAYVLHTDYIYNIHNISITYHLHTDYIPLPYWLLHTY